ncbi:hypothetical protein E2C01_056520 [Portunus trituberculatus]|uniref:Uncharacterized protein n=1 Tax=Portunus trituberculatus TaxID=210409 RepID=A0A5B7GYF0_PORTR|nr:hypothetical protein [Portunus trituberculatus]
MVRTSLPSPRTPIPRPRPGPRGVTPTSSLSLDSFMAQGPPAAAHRPAASRPTQPRRASPPRPHSTLGTPVGAALPSTLHCSDPCLVRVKRSPGRTPTSPINFNPRVALYIHIRYTAPQVAVMDTTGRIAEELQNMAQSLMVDPVFGSRGHRTALPRKR